MPAQAFPEFVYNFSNTVLWNDRRLRYVHTL